MFTFLLAICLLSPLEETTSWPAFLGAGAHGVDASALPLTWTPTENVAWSQDIVGHGQSSPVVWENFVIVTTVVGDNKDTYFVLCFDVTSGEKLWQVELANSVPVKNSVYVSRAAPTPVADGQGVIALMESGDVIAIDYQGEIRWQRKLVDAFGPFENEFGLGASLCQTADHVFALLEHSGPSHLVALSKATGETVWQAERSPRSSWSSPAIVTVAGSPQIVVSSAGSLDGYQAASGKLLWSNQEVGGNTGTTPMDLGEGRFLVAASPGRTGENAQAAAQSNGMFQIVAAGDGFQVERRWLAEKATPSWASPIFHQGLAYWVNRTGVVYCFDAETGENVYTERTRQSCWATPFAAGDRIYLFGKDGLTTVLAAGREYQVLAENVLFNAEDLADAAADQEESTEERRRAAAMFSGPTVYGYAVAGDRFLIRIGQKLFAVSQ